MKRDLDETPRILLTGRPGSGKTTAILRTLRVLGRTAAGFYTEEVRGEGRGERFAAKVRGEQRGGGHGDARRIGFDVVTLDGRRAPLARAGAAGPRVGRYGVDVAAFEAVGIPALEDGLGHPRTLLVVDELGKMEFFSDAFVALLDRLFQAPNPLLGTIMSGRHPVADRFREAPGVEIVTVTSANRHRLPEELAARFAD